ncbi:MAG: hypothetical protein K6E59_03825 [Bacilli bacterium]|nr:hypothetical protein [Bacilli bacterium]
MKPKLWQKIIVGIGVGVVIALSLAFLFVEFRLLFSGDTALYENPGVQGTKIVARILCFFLLIAHAVIGIIGLFKKGSFTTFVIFMGIAAMLVSILSFFFFEWYFGLALCIGNLLILSVTILQLIKQRIFFEERGEAESD